MTPSLPFTEDAEAVPNPNRDEMNFAEFPMAMLADRVPAEKNELTFTDTIRDSSTGADVTRRVTVRAAGGLGLPNGKDEEVLLALIALTKNKTGFGSPAVSLTRAEVRKALGWSKQGATNARIVEALNRWAGTTLHYESAWWNHTRREWETVIFHVFDTVVIGQRTGHIKLHWNPVVLGSLCSGYVKQLDWAFFQGLESATAKRLYRYLDKHFYRRSRLEYDLGTLAYEHVGLSREYEPWKVKQKLAPAIAELEEKGYLEPLGPKGRYLPAGRGCWTVVFQKKSAALEVKPAEDAGLPESSPLVPKLTERGVSVKTARELVSRHATECIERQLEAFDWLVGKKDKKVSKSPAGFLVKAVEEDFAPPHGFVPAAVKKAREEAQRAKTLEDARKRREEEREAATNGAQWRAGIDAALASMSADDHEQFVASAVGASGSFVHGRYLDAMKNGNERAAERYRYMLIEAALRARDVGTQAATA